MNEKTKRICVAGLGQFGLHLARILATDCEVLALDARQNVVNAVADDVQRALVLDLRDYNSLASVVNADFDEAIVCLGKSMEASILCTLHLRKIGVRVVRSKAVSDDHAAILKAVGASEVIFPEREIASRIAAQIVNPNLLDFVPVGGDYRVIELMPPESFCKKTLRELDVRNTYGIFVIAIKELIPPRFVLLPRPDFTIKATDILVVIGKNEDLAKLERQES